MAVKEMDITSQEGGGAALIREIQLMQELEHPNIVRYLHAQLDDEQTTVHIFLEYCSGGSLASLFKKMKRPPEEALALLDPLRRGRGAPLVDHLQKQLNLHSDGELRELQRRPVLLVLDCLDDCVGQQSVLMQHPLAELGGVDLA
eukprot:gene38258-8020_t